MKIDEELAKYLNNTGFQRFVDAWISKYQSHGRFGGKICLLDLNENEKYCLGGFLGYDLSQGKLEITFHQFEQRLKATKFEEADFLTALEILKNQKIYSKKEIKTHHDQQFIQFKTDLLKQFIDTRAYVWLNYYFLNDPFAKRFFEDNHIRYQNILICVCKALNNLPVYLEKLELLAVFAQRITKDPHYFDEDLAQDLLLKGISFLFKTKIESKTSESVSEIFYQAGILKDDLSNYCYICHLLPQSKNQTWKGFYDAYEPWNMNFYNIKNINEKFIAIPVFIVENPSVFRVLCLFIKENNLDIALVCSNGQINLCTYFLLDKLAASGCQLYYAGDFDPEGLIIAEKLKKKYNTLILCNYNKMAFDQIKVHQIEILDKRLQMLNSLTIEELVLIGKVIKETFSFGYQEGLIEDYKKFILNILK